MALPRYLTIDDATRRYRIPADQLRRLVAAGKIRAVQIGDQLAVCEDDMKNTLPKRRQDTPEWKALSHLEGHVIWVSEASRKYGVPHPTISGWIKRGWVRVVGKEKNRVLLNERDIAYLAQMYKRFGGRGRQLPDYAIAY